MARPNWRAVKRLARTGGGWRGGGGRKGGWPGPWVEGDSLHTLIAEANKRRPIPPEVAVRLIADTAAGLHAAHELRGWDGQLKEVVHCDVSPHNILIGLDGVVKLVDFGVAGAMNQ